MSKSSLAFTREYIPEFARRFKSEYRKWKNAGYGRTEKTLAEIVSSKCSKRIGGNSISDYMNGRTIPTEEVAEALAEALGLSDPFYFFPEYLMWTPAKEDPDLCDQIIVSMSGRVSVIDRDDYDYFFKRGDIDAFMYLPTPYRG